ncbi:MAG: recombinase family protein [Dyella sp.]|nr:recombinase family protein [Dyella sp.]MBV8273527.1 recombinase family protein [Cupriavidus sp.]
MIEYARISINDQHLNLQRDALAKAGCERVSEDTASGAKAERTGLTVLLATQAGDFETTRHQQLMKDIKGAVFEGRLIALCGGVGFRAGNHVDCKHGPFRFQVATLRGQSPGAQGQNKEGTAAGETNS